MNLLLITISLLFILSGGIISIAIYMLTSLGWCLLFIGIFCFIITLLLGNGYRDNIKNG